MKKRIPFLLSMALIFSALGSNAQTFPTTSWSDQADVSWYMASETEFTLSTAEALAGVAELVADGNDFSGKTILLDADIDLDGHLWSPIGTDIDFVFSGSVEGQGHTIQNLWINMPEQDMAALFGFCVEASISDIRVDGATVRGHENVATLVANLSTDSYVENCHATNVDIAAQECNVGGLVGGFLTNGSIMRSSAEGSVSGFCQVGGLVGGMWQNCSVSESHSEGSVDGTYLVGGLIGTSIPDFFGSGVNVVTDCYSRANVTADDQRAGGFIGGGASFDIQNSYSTGTATAVEYAGGFIGIIGNGSGENNYFDVETSGTTEGAGGYEGPPVDLGISGKTTAEMTTQDMVDSLNAGNPDGPWVLVPDANDGYPVLMGEPLSVEDHRLPAHAVRTYPTVFDEDFTVESDLRMERYALYDLSGTLVEAGRLNAERAQIAPRSLSAGMYLLRIHTAEGVVSKKLIKR